MKNLNRIIVIILAIFSCQLNAIELGTVKSYVVFDTSDDFSEYSSGDIITDSQGNVYQAFTRTYIDSGDSVNKVIIIKYLSNGNVDLSFGNAGELNIGTTTNNNNTYVLEIGKLNDGTETLLFGYSQIICPTPDIADCHSDIKIINLSVAGIELGSIDIPFNEGSTYLRQDDDFTDLTFIWSLNKVAITAEIERSDEFDTDFGVAMLTLNPVTGELNMDTSFGIDNDGKTQCYFDQGGASGKFDRPESVVYDFSSNSIIVGGTAFEGNGLSSQGTNMAFCNFSMDGSVLLPKWTTQDGVISHSVEKVYDMKIAVEGIGNTVIYVTGTANGSDLTSDVVLLKYHKPNTNWIIDSSFGSNNGWNTVGFTINSENTSDEGRKLFLENDGSILIAGTSKFTTFKRKINLVKYRKDGSLYKSWGSRTVYPKGTNVIQLDSTQYQYCNVLGMTEDVSKGIIYIVGNQIDTPDTLAYMAKLHNDMIFGNTFE